MSARPGRRAAGVALVGVLALALVGCTGNGDPQRSRTATVAVGYAFGSLNAATSQGRTPGSTLVRGLTHAGFASLDATGAAVPNPSFGTVEKVLDSPLTVRYTIGGDARWSDGVPVTGADLLLEWAARSGQLDEAVPTLGADGTLTDAAALDQQVAFAATSPALVHATATPTFDAHSLTLVYDQPVADWQVALDVNLPAHVIGRLALGAASTTAPTPQVSASGLGVGGPTAAGSAPTSASATASAGTSSSGTSPAGRASATPADWATAVTDAIVHDDRTALVAISRTWRTAADAGALAGDLSAAVDDGPYVITSVAPDRQVVLEPNRSYSGAHPARFARVVVRSDLAPLDQVAALGKDEVDVAAPVDTADVRTALAALSGATVADGGDRVLQLQLGEKSGGAFDPSSTSSGGPAAANAARAAFLGSLDPTALAAAAGLEANRTVLAQVGIPAGSAAAPTGSAGSAAAPTATSGPRVGSTPVRLLVDTGDPVRAALAASITTQAAAAGFTVTLVDTGDLATTLWSDPTAWDAALVPVAQGELPVASVVARWHSGGATNVTGHADPALDALLDQAATTSDPGAAHALLDTVSGMLTSSDVVLPLVRQPVLAATDAHGDGPKLTGVTPPTWGSADLSGWWAWARS